ncbi:MAG: hypothetical protein KAT16_07770 [Candidatus Heimdallarchaeota archaeon]|nr:hypothetical protein [Candidatus Heimdallarchaeota archaeon]
MSKPSKMPIRDIYLIHESGLVLVSRHYHDGDIQPDIVGGFFIAMANFVEQMMGESIQEIKLDQHLIVYKKIGPIFAALVSEPKKITKRRLTILMKSIVTKFFDEYVVYLEEGLIEPSMFFDFGNTLDKIVSANCSLKNIL